MSSRNDQPKGGDAALYPSIKDDQTIPRQLGPGDSAKSPGPQDVRERLEQTALAIHKARFAHPEHPREPDPFTDEGDREYCFRLARAALAQSDARPVGSPAKEEIEVTRVLSDLEDFFVDLVGDFNDARALGNPCFTSVVGSRFERRVRLFAERLQELRDRAADRRGK